MTDLKYETDKVDADIALGHLRPECDVREAIRKRLYPIAGDQPTCVRYDLLLPRSVPDTLAHWEKLAVDFVAAQLPDQRDWLSVLTLRLDPDEPLHIGWEQSRTFCLAEFALSEVSAPVVLVQHDPGQAGRSSPPHCHALIFARRFRQRWSVFHDVTKPGAKARIATAWTAWLASHP